MTDLLPCPFCGSLAIELVGSWVVCNDCDTTGVPAVEAWNHRAAGWIPVSERLPEEDRNVIVWSPDEGVLLGFRDGPQWYDAFTEIERNVTHWMPLPEPPEVNDE